MVTYNYTVGQQGYKAIQQVIDNIRYELSSLPVLEGDIVVNVNSGIHAAFTIPDSLTASLLSSTYRVVIKASGKFFPIIESSVSPEETYIGIDILGANPNITIEGLRVQGFSVGLRASQNSHNVIVRDCIFNDNYNVNILIEQCTNSIISQNIITNGDFGIACRLCKNIAILHNSIFLAGTRGDASGAIWAQLANDYGGGLTDTGKLHLLGNIVWNMVGPDLILFQEDIELKAIVSNFNDLVKTTANIIAVEKKAYVPNQPRERKNIASLLAWKDERILSNPDNSILDAKSISQDPKFVQTVKSRNKQNGLYIDLTVLTISPVLGIVPSFYADISAALTWLPSYVDSSILSKDILGNDRLRDGTAAGANDKRSNSGFFGQDVFVSPRDLLAKKHCDLDPIKDLIYKKLDLWMPKINKGYFYSNEREYYLYAKKVCRYIGECAVTFFDLPGKIVDTRPIRVAVAGKKIEDPRYIDLRGNQFVLYHFDLDIQDGTEEIEIEAWIRIWKDTSFIYSPVYYRFKIQEGTTRFFLPEDYAGEGPVVITDDRSTGRDVEELCNREFKLSFDALENKTEIIFANKSNQLNNCQFDKFLGTDTYAPLNWMSSKAEMFSGDYNKNNPVAGDYICNVYPAGYIAQMVPIDQNNYSFSWHARVGYPFSESNHDFTNTSQTRELYFVSLYDADYNSIGVTLSGSHLLTLGSDNTWKRYYVTLGSGLFLDSAQSIKYPVVNLENFSNIPEVAKHALIKLENNSYANNIQVDALQYEKADRPSPYHRKLRYSELTVEYETSNNKHFIDSRQTLSPVRNSFAQGFIHIPEIPASLYDGPADAIVTTLNEVRWPYGRMLILPWARLTGKDKLREKVVFNSIPEKKKQIIDPAHTVHWPNQLSIIPSKATCKQGNKNGTSIYVQCSATDGNPYALGKFFIGISDPMGRFPGWLSKKYCGLNEQLGPLVIGSLDNSGGASVTWIPPDEAVVGYYGSVPTRRSDKSQQITSVELNFRADPEYNGNVIILDSNYNPIPTKAANSSVTTYKTTYSENFSTVVLNYPPTAGTVKVKVNDIYLTETMIASPNSDQFFVNYQSNKILLKGRIPEVEVEYIPSYVFINTANPYRLHFYHNQLFGDYSGSITIGYDALIDLRVGVYYPDKTTTITEMITLTAQNHLTANYRYLNELALEY